MKFCHMRIIFAYTAFQTKKLLLMLGIRRPMLRNEDEDNVKLSDLKIVEHDQKGLFTPEEELLIGPLKLKKKDIIILF